MKKWFWILFLVALPFSRGETAQASLVKELSLDEACDGNVTVDVYRGMGAAIDFTQSGYTVQRAWLGDPSKLTLDTDSPIEHGSTSVIYLREIDELFFNGLPATDSTVLTMQLFGSQGARVCQLPITFASGEPAYTSVRLLTAATSTDAVRVRPAITRLSRLQLDYVETGIRLNASSLGEDSPVVRRVNDFISRVRDGQPQQSAARELGIEWALLLELERQGSAEDNAYETVSS